LKKDTDKDQDHFGKILKGPVKGQNPNGSPESGKIDTSQHSDIQRHGWEFQDVHQ
jgi:hypothetical protein